MNFLPLIKWYHLTITILLAVILFLIIAIWVIRPNALGHTENFEETPQQTAESKIAGEITLYYAMWCGYSRQFLPEWEKFEAFAKQNFPNLRVSRVRCEDGHEATCSQKGVQGYPTVILYLKDNSEKTFDGERNSEKLIEFCKKFI
jgi:thiol-disulfide isomerase/thioredoxin